ncbi:hypothetical protein A2U01_0060561, partial [Trifolium medium]|nr:hypothetical protein [Trifolium medium]
MTHPSNMIVGLSDPSIPSRTQSMQLNFQ